MSALLHGQGTVYEIGQALEVCTALGIGAGVLHLGLYALEGAQVIGAVHGGVGDRKSVV